MGEFAVANKQNVIDVNWQFMAEDREEARGSEQNRNNNSNMINERMNE